MKFLRLAVVFVILSICVLYCTAVPFSKTLMQETERSGVQVEELQHTAPAAEETNPLGLFRTKRQIYSHLSLCRYCCNCCRNKGCGFCCRF